MIYKFNMNCPDCATELSVSEHQSGDIVLCKNCGCEMELLNKDPLEIRVIEEEK